jgi:hypothetical protein
LYADHRPIWYDTFRTRAEREADMISSAPKPPTPRPNDSHVAAAVEAAYILAAVRR